MELIRTGGPLIYGVGDAVSSDSVSLTTVSVNEKSKKSRLDMDYGSYNYKSAWGLGQHELKPK